jgi:hypothetical protein
MRTRLEHGMDETDRIGESSIDKLMLLRDFCMYILPVLDSSASGSVSSAAPLLVSSSVLIVVRIRPEVEIEVEGWMLITLIRSSTPGVPIFHWPHGLTDRRDRTSLKEPELARSTIAVEIARMTLLCG